MKPIIIDVREPDEYKDGHVVGAINIPLSNFEENLSALNNVSKETPIITYCQSGRRSGMAIEMLRQEGYANLINGINQAGVENIL